MTEQSNELAPEALEQNDEFMDDILFQAQIDDIVGMLEDMTVDQLDTVQEFVQSITLCNGCE